MFRGLTSKTLFFVHCNFFLHKRMQLHKNVKKHCHKRAMEMHFNISLVSQFSTNSHLNSPFVGEYYNTGSAFRNTNTFLILIQIHWCFLQRASKVNFVENVESTRHSVEFSMCPCSNIGENIQFPAEWNINTLAQRGYRTPASRSYGPWGRECTLIRPICPSGDCIKVDLYLLFALINITIQ